MKFIVSILFTALLVYTAFLFDNILPWWAFAIGAFLAGWVVPQKAWLSWLGGFAGVLGCWFVLTWNINHDNHSLLATRMGELFGLKSSPIIMMLITSLLGALIGGFASLTGAFVRKKPAPVNE